MGFSLLPEPTGNEGKTEARYDFWGIAFRNLSRLFTSHIALVTPDTFAFRGLLRWAALFLGELRDGLTMINMQSAFLIVSKQYTEKQAGVLFFGKSSSLVNLPLAV